jgi:hypothetical protein
MHVALLRTRNNQELHPPRSRAARRHSSSSDSSTTTTTIHQGKSPILHHKAREVKTAQQASGCDGEQKRRQQKPSISEGREGAVSAILSSLRSHSIPRGQRRVGERLGLTLRPTVARVRLERWCLKGYARWATTRSTLRLEQHLGTTPATRRSRTREAHCKVGSVACTLPCPHA